ncbi:MAG: GntR family transcriptional regulator [Actinomycetota bacterium]|nr:GntR family transcriptional regulator [Actinomycetota bacterium]
MTERARGEGLPLTEWVHARLREDILHARLLPGTTVLEPELAARFGVSKTPVREALRLLVQDGWVIVLPRRGYLVRPLGLEDLRDVFQLREMIEPGFAAEAAARVTAADPALATAISTQGKAKREVATALGAAADFHVRVAELSGNARATRIVSNLVDEVTRLHFLIPTLESHISSADEIAAHEEIARSIAAGDERKAAKAMRDHLRTTHRILVDVFAVPRRAARA